MGDVTCYIMAVRMLITAMFTTAGSKLCIVPDPKQCIVPDPKQGICPGCKARIQATSRDAAQCTSCQVISMNMLFHRFLYADPFRGYSLAANHPSCKSALSRVHG
jgi:hypothetical protein